MATKHKRLARNFFIKRDFQGRIALTIFLATVICCLIYMILLALFSADTMTISYNNNGLQVGKTPWMLLKSALAANWLFLLVGGTLLVLAAIVGTHRIAGPMYRLEKSLAAMASGDLSTTISLREKDEGKDLAQLINKLSSNFSLKIREIERSSGAINNLLDQYANLDSALISPEDATSICKAIRTHNKRVQDQLQFFRLKDEK